MNFNQTETERDWDALTQQIYQETDYDFVAIAMQGATAPHLTRWVYASGNQSQSFRRIVLRKGFGIAGLVLRTGKPFYHNDILKLHYSNQLYSPIARSENLKQVVAVPINDKYLKVAIGVLLVGYRSFKPIIGKKDVVKLEKYLR